MLELKTADDIIVPFDRMGDPDWEKNSRMLLTEQAEEWGSPMPQPVDEALITATEKRLGVTLPSDLALFYRTFGVADIGEEMQALENMENLSVWAAGFEPEEFMDPEELAILPHLVTFSEYLGNGNAFCFHRDTGEIYYFDHDTAPHLVKLFDRAGDYLKGCLVKLQEAFFVTGDGPDIVEEKLVELFGEERITKWLY